MDIVLSSVYQQLLPITSALVVPVYVLSNKPSQVLSLKLSLAFKNGSFIAKYIPASKYIYSFAVEEMHLEMINAPYLPFDGLSLRLNEGITHMS